MMQIAYISDAKAFLQAFSLIEERSLTRYLDENKIKVEGPRSLLAILGEFRNPECKFAEDLCLQKHVYLGFLLLFDRKISGPDFMAAFGHLFAVTPSVGWNMVYASASLFNFYTAIRLGSERPEFRQILNSIHGLLEEQGFFDLFKNFSRRTFNDGTYNLCS